MAWVKSPYGMRPAVNFESTGEQVYGTKSAVVLNRANGERLVRAQYAKSRTMESAGHELQRRMRDRAATALRGLGSLGLSGVLVPGVTFPNDDAMNDFTTGLTLRGPAGYWGGVPTSLIQAVNARLIDAEHGSDTVRQRVADTFRATANSLAKQISDKQGFGLFGRSEAQDSQYKSLMEALKRLMQQFVEDYNRLPAPGTAAAGSSGPITNNGFAPQLLEATSSGGGFIPQKAALTADVGGLPAWAMPLGVVAGVGVLGYGFYVALKKKGRAAPVAGLRRRRRRSRR